MGKTITLKFVKETKNTLRYEDESKSGVIFRDTLYISKEVLDGSPEEIIVTIAPYTSSGLV